MHVRNHCCNASLALIQISVPESLVAHHTHCSRQSTSIHLDERCVRHETAPTMVVASRVLFFHEMHFLLLYFFHTDPIFISKMWYETQKKVNLLHRDSKLVLCDYVFLYICIDLNNFRLRCFTSGEIIPRHRSLTKSEISILVNVMRELVLYVIDNCQVKLTSEQEVKVLRLISLLV